MDGVAMTLTEYELVLEALKGAKSEITAMEDTYDDYVAAGKLLEQLDEAIEILEGHCP